MLAIAFIVVGLFARPQFSLLVGICGASLLAALFLFEAMHTVSVVSVRLGMFGQLSEAEAETLTRNEKVVPGFTLRGLNRLAGTDELSEALLSGFPSTQVVLCTSNKGVVSYTADRFGFNNPDHVYDKRLDVMLLGDSFVEGFCLPPGEDLASRLRGRGLSTASIGIRGNGPLMELATLGRFGETLRPRRVVMVFFEGNDWENLERELTVPWLRAALSPNANYGLQATAKETMDQAREILAERKNAPVTSVDLLTRTALFRNFVALQQTLTRLGLVYPKITPSNPEFRRLLHRAKALTESWGGSLHWSTFPELTVSSGLSPRMGLSTRCGWRFSVLRRQRASRSSISKRPYALAPNLFSCTPLTPISVATAPNSQRTRSSHAWRQCPRMDKSSEAIDLPGTRRRNAVNGYRNAVAGKYWQAPRGWRC